MIKKILLVMLLTISMGAFAESFKSRGGPGKDYSFQISEDFARTGDSSERFEVRYGDCHKSDCIRDRQRYERGLEQPYSDDDYWYSWSFYLPDNFMIQPAGTAIGQAKLFGGSVMWMVLTKYTDYIQIASDNKEQKCNLIKMDDAVGNWTDIMIRANYSASSEAPLDVWINGKNIECNFNHPLVSKGNLDGAKRRMNSDKNEVSFKYGIYQTFISRWLDKHKTKEVSGDVNPDWTTPSGNKLRSPDNTPFNEDWGVETPVAVMFYDNVMVGDSRDEVNILYNNLSLDIKNPILKKNKKVSDNSIGFKPRKRSHKKSYGHTISEFSRTGDSSERIEIRYGDCAHSDCTQDRQRYYMYKLMPFYKDKDYWYSGSFYLSSDFMIQPAGTSLIGNAIFYNKKPGDKKVTWQIHSKMNDYLQLASGNGGKCNLVKLSSSIGKWVDYIVRANYSPNSENPVDVWINGRNSGCKLNKPLVEKNWLKGGEEYTVRHNYGIYQSFISRWLDKNKTKEVSGDVRLDWLTPSGENFKSPDNTPFNEDWGVETPTAIAYFDNILTGDSRDEVNIFYEDWYLNLPPVRSDVTAIKSKLKLSHGTFGGFDRVENDTAYGYILKKDNTSSAPTKYIESFELRSGDCQENSDWSDCKNDAERVEMMQWPKDTKLEDEQWYGWSIFFPENYKAIHPAHAVHNRFKGKSKASWDFGVKKDGYVLIAKPDGNSTNKRKYKLIEGGQLRRKWHKVEVHSKWSDNDSGFFKVWINGKQKVNYKGRTMTEESNHFRYGIARYRLSRYKDKYGTDTVPSQKIYFSNVKRSDNREGLLP